MPYYVHRKSEPDNRDTWECLRADAYTLAKTKGTDYAVTFIASNDELTSWHEREQNRLRLNHAFTVPFFVSSKYIDHYVHLSVDTPGMLAYTKDVESGIQDRQTRWHTRLWLFPKRARCCLHCLILPLW